MTLQLTFTEDKVKAKIAKNERLIAQLTAKPIDAWDIREMHNKLIALRENNNRKE